jgi:hypothetical protein
MINRQRKKIPNYVLETIIGLTTSIMLFCLSYNMILLRSHAMGSIPLQETIEKIRYVFKIKKVAHVILFLALILRGWWYIGLATFPVYFILAKLCLIIYTYFST